MTLRRRKFTVVSEYHVYIMTNNSGTLYVGMTNDLRRRVREHRAARDDLSFTARYRVTRLVYYEPVSGDVYAALAREKEIKGWLRRRKVALIASQNPKWRDLSPEVTVRERRLVV